MCGNHNSCYNSGGEGNLRGNCGCGADATYPIGNAYASSAYGRNAAEADAHACGECNASAERGCSCSVICRLTCPLRKLLFGNCKCPRS